MADGGHPFPQPAETMWNLRTLAECLLNTPAGAPINEGLARDLAREALAVREAVQRFKWKLERGDQWDITCAATEWLALLEKAALDG